jgi:hypothetical protein
MGRRQLRPLFFALVIGLLAVTVLLLQEGGQGSASEGWAYRYGRSTQRLDRGPGLRGFRSYMQGNLAAGGPGVVVPVLADEVWWGDWNLRRSYNAGALLAIQADGQRAWSWLYYMGTWPESAEFVPITVVKPYGNGFLAAGEGFLMEVYSDGTVVWAVTGLGLD